MAITSCIFSYTLYSFGCIFNSTLKNLFNKYLLKTYYKPIILFCLIVTEVNKIDRVSNP